MSCIPTSPVISLPRSSDANFGLKIRNLSFYSNNFSSASIWMGLTITIDAELRPIPCRCNIDWIRIWFCMSGNMNFHFYEQRISKYCTQIAASIKLRQMASACNISTNINSENCLPFKFTAKISRHWQLNGAYNLQQKYKFSLDLFNADMVIWVLNLPHEIQKYILALHFKRKYPPVV